MRLLNTTTLQVALPPPREATRYAILSHRWLDQEVTLQDIENGTAHHKTGYKKLQACCRLAKSQGYDWVWMDTCCIDKTSSAELSEAINSMYAWYKGADICYAYLDDATDVDTLRDSKWFTRGWTLQELLAPRNLVLLVPASQQEKEKDGGQWRAIGTRKELADTLSSITSIGTDVLLGRKSPLRCNVAQRMAWVSDRQTTRSEDLAYCLLGLFDIQMPPIYGEGREKAFLRLQREILLHNSDQTIFLWTPAHDPYNQGLLATSPAAFCIHNECFQSKLRVLSATNSDELRLPADFGRDPYSFFTALDFSRRRNFVGLDFPTAISERLEQTQVNVLAFPGALGPNGLYIPLLVSNQVTRGTSQVVLVRLDVTMALNNKWTGSVLIYLVNDVAKEKEDIAIPNGLGTWRRQTHTEEIAGITINFADIDFEQKVMTVSQLSTAGTGESCCAPIMFAVRREDDRLLRSQQVFVMPSRGQAVRPVPPEELDSFFGAAGFITGYHCDECKERDPKTVLIIAFGVRGSFSDPWCCIWNCMADHAQGIFPEMESLQIRFGPTMQRGPSPGCGKIVQVAVFREEEVVGGEHAGDKYIVHIADIDDD